MELTRRDALTAVGLTAVSATLMASEGAAGLPNICFRISPNIINSRAPNR